MLGLGEIPDELVKRLEPSPSARALDLPPTASKMPNRRRQPTHDDEPLVEIDEVRCLDAYEQLGIGMARTPFRLRLEAARRLAEANRSLPMGLSVVVLDAWRTLEFQRHLGEVYRDRAGGTGDVGSARPVYVASTTSTSMRPPHVTGGAVDLTLEWRGVPLALGSDFDDFSARAHADAFESAPSPARLLRRILINSLAAVGFVVFPFEWWHFSYGDDVWSATIGEPPRYDVVTS